MAHQLTCVTPHVNFQAAGLIVGLVAAWVGAAELARFSEVSAIVWEEGTEGDEGFLAACIGEESSWSLINQQCTNCSFLANWRLQIFSKAWEADFDLGLYWFFVVILNVAKYSKKRTVSELETMGWLFITNTT